MKKLLLFLILTIVTKIFAQQSPDWEDPQIIGINKEPYHATLTLPSKKMECGELVSLNGKWKFHWAKNPDERPVDFYKTDFDASGWNDIIVPGNWQMQGYDIPIYTNTLYPFKKDQPYVMGEPPKEYFSYENRNPVGSYITNIEITPEMKGKALFLHFEGVESAMYIWINGKKVGYSQNSMSPAEFDVTKYLKVGKNKLAVEVYRWSDGSYLEDQDMWRLSGIFRPVELWVRPQSNIRDYTIEAIPSEDFSTAELNTKFHLRNLSNKKAKNLTLAITVSGKNTKDVAININLKTKFFSIDPNGTFDVELNSILENPELWSAEKPNLFAVDIQLLQKGKTIEHFKNQVGVRRIEIKGEVVLVNNKPVKFKGVNRHEHHPRTGRYVDEETLIKDMNLMKQANINMIRTSHYPSMPLFYELCDKYGFYVMSEANNESHGYGIGKKELGNDPKWRKAFLDRAISLVQRDKNHPSILLWSLGNEASAGNNPKAMADTIKVMDPRRIVFYDSDRSISEIYDDSYLHPDQMIKIADRVKDKPFIMREYAHAMGNSLGNFQEYWDIIENREDIVGAAIWEWLDHGIAKKIDGSSMKYSENPSNDLSLHADEYWAYGGDFGDHPNSGAFCIDGLIRADRVPNPHYYQVGKVYQNIGFTLQTNGKIKLTNKFNFTKLNEFDYTYEWLKNGEKFEQGIAVLNGDELTIPNTPDFEGELAVNIYATLRQSKLWADKGFIVAKEQFILRNPIAETIVENEQKPFLTESVKGIEVNAGNNHFCFNTQTGALTSWKNKEEELLKGDLEPYFWKPANDNQKRNKYNQRLSNWKIAGEERNVQNISKSVKGNLVIIEVDMKLAIGANYKLKYTVNGTGQLQVEASYTPTKDSLQLMPKFGMRMQILADYEQIEWYGRGPQENYPDRKTGYFIATHKLPIQDFMVNYAVPQDNANRSDTRWFSFGHREKKIRIGGLQPLNFRAWTYNEDDLEKSKHPFDLPKRDYINVNIDYKIHGVGGNDSWGARTMDAYTIDGNKPYYYGFVLECLER